MTIAACFVTGEGVVLGADSTTSFGGGDELRCFDHAQKIYQVDEAGAFGIVTWGMGDVSDFTIRNTVARFGDDLKQKPAKTVEEAAQRWAAFFWKALNDRFGGQLDPARALRRRLDVHLAMPEEKRDANPDKLSEKELSDLEVADGTAGFCIGGRCEGERKPGAYFMHIRSVADAAPKPEAVPRGVPLFWGAPRMLERVMLNYDDAVVNDIMASKKWTGTRDELLAHFFKHQLKIQGLMPIRDAIDLVHSAISMTSKWIRFAQLPPICGGAVEVALITADRPFRWVRHKPFDVAI